MRFGAGGGGARSGLWGLSVCRVGMGRVVGLGSVVGVVGQLGLLVAVDVVWCCPGFVRVLPLCVFVSNKEWERTTRYLSRRKGLANQSI